MSEWCRCDDDMKKPRMGSTKAYVPFGALIEAAQMRHYHNKLVEGGKERIVLRVVKVLLNIVAVVANLNVNDLTILTIYELV